MIVEITPPLCEVQVLPASHIQENASFPTPGGHFTATCRAPMLGGMVRIVQLVGDYKTLTQGELCQNY